MAGDQTTARRPALALGATRCMLGAAMLLATDPVLRAVGFGETDATGRALARLSGGRDLALGLLTVAAGGDERRLRRLTLVAVALDAADALTMAAAARRREIRVAALAGAASGAGAAAAGAWAARGLD